jgi:hypothetical protein
MMGRTYGIQSFVAGLVFSVGLGACAREEKASVWLSDALRAQSSADEAQQRGDIVAARKALSEAVAAKVPDSVAQRDGRIVRQDLYYRLALMELQNDAPEHALSWADNGLSLGQARDVFTINLYIARGRAREALGEDVLAGRDYHEALKLSEALLDESLESDTE